MNKLSFERKFVDFFVQDLARNIFFTTQKAWKADIDIYKKAGWGVIDHYLIFIYTLFTYTARLTLTFRDPLNEVASDIEEELKKRDPKGLKQVQKEVKDKLFKAWDNQEDINPWPQYLITVLQTIRRFAIAEGQERGNTPEILEEKNQEAIFTALGHFFFPVFLFEDYEDYKDSEFNDIYERNLDTLVDMLR
jgi:hypothetical protein